MTLSSFPPPTPHDPIVEVAPDLFLVRGTFRMAPGLVISRTMAIVRHEGELTLVNSVRLVDDSALTALGKVKHLVKLADAHGIDDAYYMSRFNPTFWSCEGASHPAIPRGRTLGPECPIPGGHAYVIAGGRSPEGALWVPHGGAALITCDALQNHVDTHGASLFARVMTPLLGFTGGVIVAKMWRKNHGLSGPAVRAALAPLLERPFQALITAHGPAAQGDAHALVRSAIEAASA